MNKSTKIVATIGPATDTEEKIAQLIDAGMNVARFNTKHGTVEWHKERIERVKKVANALHQPIGVLLDLQGPEIRITIPNGETFPIQDQEVVVFTSDQASTDPKKPIVPKIVIQSLKPGDHIMIDDGLGEFAVMSQSESEMTAVALGNFKVSNRKTLNTPGAIIDLPSLIDQDLKQLDANIGNSIDFVGLSFVRNAQDIQILKDELKKRNIQAGVVAKIENQSAVDHLEEIIAVSDVVMVARGDLAVEVPFEELAFWQKTIINKCRELGKPVITATQMLKSMVENPRPTRAEVSDVANAIFDGSDAIMLSEETTVGKFPVEAVKTQRVIAEFNETHANFQPIKSVLENTAACVTQAAMQMLQTINKHSSSAKNKVDKIVCLTETGNTARLTARFRPNIPIYALTSSEHTYVQLSVVYGVTPQMIKLPDGDQLESSQNLIDQLLNLNIVKKGETILLIHGTFWKKPGLTNTLTLLNIP